MLFLFEKLFVTIFFTNWWQKKGYIYISILWVCLPNQRSTQKLPIGFSQSSHKPCKKVSRCIKMCCFSEKSEIHNKYAMSVALTSAEMLKHTRKLSVLVGSLRYFLWCLHYVKKSPQRCCADTLHTSCRKQLPFRFLFVREDPATHLVMLYSRASDKKFMAKLGSLHC